MILTEINHIIKKQICYNIINQLHDDNLLNEYLKTNSVNKSINNLINILQDVNVDNDKIEQIKSKYITKLIPSGTKSVIRGNKFNEIIKEHIINLNLDNDIFDIKFEKKCDYLEISERPDWIIKNKINNKIIIGMNQMDLWNGGHQLNRGTKYIINNRLNTDKTKLLCVICNDIKIKKTNNKIFNILKIGFTNDTLCYIKNIKNIINKFLL